MSRVNNLDTALWECQEAPAGGSRWGLFPSLVPTNYEILGSAAIFSPLNPEPLVHFQNGSRAVQSPHALDMALLSLSGLSLFGDLINHHRTVHSYLEHYFQIDLVLKKYFFSSSWCLVFHLDAFNVCAYARVCGCTALGYCWRSPVKDHGKTISEIQISCL